MPKPIQSTTGKAQLVRHGHTTDRQHGSDPDARAKGRPSVTDLTVK